MQGKIKIQIINGPNLNLLGVREPEMYGTECFETFFEQLQNEFPEYELFYFQSNIEGEIIDKLHEIGFNFDGVLINAGGYTHTSVAIGDAIASISSPTLEIHISNIFARESYRHVSMIGQHCVGSISGFGLKSYKLGLEFFKP
jgi:3-dehydroquinate dehydratase-2